MHNACRVSATCWTPFAWNALLQSSAHLPDSLGSPARGLSRCSSDSAADQVTHAHVTEFGIVVQSHPFQTLLEALAVLVAVRLWAQQWRDNRLYVRGRIGSLSTLAARAPNPEDRPCSCGSWH